MSMLHKLGEIVGIIEKYMTKKKVYKLSCCWILR